MHLQGPHGGSDRSDEAQYDIEFFARKHGLPPELACHIIDYAPNRARADAEAERAKSRQGLGWN